MTEQPKVTMNGREITMAAMVGVMRQVENLEAGRKHAHGADPSTEWQMHVEGAIGEAVVAKWLNRYWAGALGDLKADDVGALQVRYTYRENGCLILHPTDPDDRRFILVTGLGPTYTLRGWLWGKDGKRQEWWKDPRGNRPAFFVPQSALRPMRPRQTVT